MASLELDIQGMTCDACVGRVTKALEEVPGVARASVTLAPPRAVVEGAELDPARLRAALGRRGYRLASPTPTPTPPPTPTPTPTPAVETQWFDVSGMTCGSCVGAVTRAVEAVPGVARVDVSLPQALCRVEAPRARGPDVVAAVRAAGYEATPRAPETDALAREAEADRRRVAHAAVARRRALVAALVTAPLVMLAMGGMLAWEHPPAWAGWTEGALALAALVAGAPVFRTALVKARHGAANMDSLVALGTLAAFALSAWLLVTGAHAHLHFEAAGVVMALVLLGRALEARAQGRTGEALRRLIDLRPATALRVEQDGSAREVPVADVRPGDRLRVLPGAMIPVDGRVVEGASWVSEALITGESMPLPRRTGDAVIGGTQNGEGPLLVLAERVGGDTELARIVRLVAEAQGSKATIERVADRVSATLVPVVLLLAALTAGGWLGAGRGLEAAALAAASVLVVACPCAMGLATPTAVVVAVGRAARLGIFVRDARSLEALATVTHALLDKTGTLTRGRPEVVAVHARGVDEDGLVGLAAAVEAQSEHPLAAGILAERDRRGLPPLAAREVEVDVGGGIAGEVHGARVLVGAGEWLAGRGVDVAALVPAPEGEATVVGVARDGHLVGTLHLADPVRPGAGDAVAALRRAGVTPLLLTGDAAPTAARVAAAVGIAPGDVRAGVRPDGKVAEVERLIAQGARVAMVGDGLNDAPALARAHVGIAIGGGAQAAREAAAMALIPGDDPRAIAEAALLARATLRTIRQNLAWAFAYNVVALPLAALGVLPPVAAAAAMAASSILVVSNSLRLRRRPLVRS